MDNQIEPTIEKSEQQAAIIEQIKFYLQCLDVDYLKLFIKNTQSNLLFKESAVILAPDATVQMVKNQYDRTVLVFAQKLVDLIEYRNNDMKEAFISLEQSKDHSEVLKNLFK